MRGHSAGLVPKKPAWPAARGGDQPGTFARSSRSPVLGDCRKFSRSSVFLTAVALMFSMSGLAQAALGPLSIKTTSLKDGQVGKKYNTKLKATGGVKPLLWSIVSGALPAGLELDQDKGSISGTPLEDGTFELRFRVESQDESAEQPLSLLVETNPAVATSSLKDGQVGKKYNTKLKATGGVKPLLWSIVSGALPAGLELDQDKGSISGTPLEDGIFEFILKVTDSEQNSGERTLTLLIEKNLPMVTTTALKDGQVDKKYNAKLQAKGGVKPYTWFIPLDGLPEGLELDAMTGAISGVPTGRGSCGIFTAKVHDEQGQAGTRDLALDAGVSCFLSREGPQLPPKSGPASVVVRDLNGDGIKDLIIANELAKILAVVTDTLEEGRVDKKYSARLEAQGGVQPYTWSIASGALPNGLELDPDKGSIAGKPTEEGIFEIMFRVTDALGESADRTLSLPIDAELPEGGGSEVDVPEGNVTILLGNPDGTFQEPLVFAAGNVPGVVVVQDLNGDDLLDLVTANAVSNDVSVLLGAGEVAFQLQEPLPVGSRPFYLATGDLNGDGILDLATANLNSNDVSVLFGQGDGTFQEQQTLAVGSGPSSIALGDLNGDAATDIVTANIGSNDISVLLGNGDGTFQEQQTFAVGSGPFSVLLSDLNDDNVPDVVTANFGSDDISVLLGTGDGTFEDGRTFRTGTEPVFVAAGDLNGDGTPDLVTTNFKSGDLSVLFGNGDGQFQPERRFEAGDQPGSVVIDDLDGDTIPDLIVPNYDSDDISLLFGNPDAY